MNKNHLIALAIVLVVGLIGYGLYLNNTRFYIMTTSKGVAYEVDRRSGKTWTLRGSTKTEQVDESVINRSLKPIPYADLSMLTGSSSLYSYGFRGSIYNGTSWTVKEITFQVTVQEPDGSVRWTREYTDSVNIAPKTSGDADFDVTGAHTFGKFTWNIVSAKGTQ